MEVKANSDNSSLLVVSSVCGVQVLYGLIMIAPFEGGMDIVLGYRNKQFNCYSTN